MHIKHCTKLDEIPIDRVLWDKLVSLSDTDTIFQTYDWFHSWWKTYGHQYQLMFLIAYDKEDIIGFAPLMMRNQQWFKPALRFVGDNNADYCDFIISKNRLEVAACFLEYLYSGVISWSKFNLQNIPDTSTTYALLQTLAHANHYAIVTKRAIAAPTLLIKNHEEDALSRSNKYSVMRHVNKLNNLGDLSFEVFSSKEIIKSHINSFFEQHINRYKNKSFDSLFNSDENKEFYKTLIDTIKDEYLSFSILKINNVPIAYHFGFDYKNTIYWYKPSFNINYTEYSPGSILIKHVIEYCVSNNKNEFDFTVGEEKFKNRFCNHIRYNNNIIMHNNHLFYACDTIYDIIIFVLRKFRSIFYKLINRQ